MAEHASHDERDRGADGHAAVARVPQEEPARAVAPAPTQGAPARTRAPAPSQALALQRAVGNRAAARMLTRWAAHPDKDKKGVMMPDAMATEFLRFNPPLSK
jgi:hypothetical protein